MRQYYVYIPGDSAVKGPFPAEMIRNAYEQGIYNDVVLLRDVHGGDWIGINTVFTKAQPTFPAVPPPLPPVPVMPPVPVTESQKEAGVSSPDSAQKSAGQWGCGGIWGTLFGLGIVVRWILRYYKKNDFGDSIGWDILFILLIVGAVVGAIGAICDHCSKK